MMNPSNLAILAQGLPGVQLTDPGVAQGQVTGLRISDYLDNMDRARRMDDLSYASEKNTLEQTLLDNPQKEAERKLKLALTGLDQANVDSGLTQQTKQAEMQAKLDDLYNKRGAQAVKEIQAHGDLAISAQNEADSGTMTPERWNSYRSAFAKNGVQMPASFAEAAPMIKSISEKAYQNADYLRKKAEQERAQSNAIELRGTESADAKLRAQATVDAANARVNSPASQTREDQDKIRENAILKKSDVNQSDLHFLAYLENENFKKTGYSKELEMFEKRMSEMWAQNPKLREEWKDRGGRESFIDAAKEEARLETISRSLAYKLSGKPLVDDSGKVIIKSISASSKDRIKKYMTGELDTSSSVGPGSAERQPSESRTGEESLTLLEDKFKSSDEQLKFINQLLANPRTKDSQATKDLITAWETKNGRTIKGNPTTPVKPIQPAVIPGSELSNLAAP